MAPRSLVLTSEYGEPRARIMMNGECGGGSEHHAPPGCAGDVPRSDVIKTGCACLSPQWTGCPAVPAALGQVDGFS